MFVITVRTKLREKKIVYATSQVNERSKHVWYLLVKTLHSQVVPVVVCSSVMFFSLRRFFDP